MGDRTGRSIRKHFEAMNLARAEVAFLEQVDVGHPDCPPAGLERHSEHRANATFLEVRHEVGPLFDGITGAQGTPLQDDLAGEPLADRNPVSCHQPLVQTEGGARNELALFEQQDRTGLGTGNLHHPLNQTPQ